MPKFVFLSRYYLLNKRNLKIKFICEIAIFVVILALISSIISIYYEGKLAKHSNELVKLEIQEHTIQEWLTDAPERNLENRLSKFLYRLVENNENFNLDEKRYYFYLLTWYPNTIDFAIKDIDLIQNKKLKKKYNLEKIKQENNEIYDFVYSIHDKLKEGEWFDDKVTDKYFVNIEKKNLIKLLDKSEYNIFQINLFFQEYNNIVDNKKKLLVEKIDLVDKKSKETMLIAFFFQLLIFFVVQFLEIREIKSAKKNIK